MTRIAVVTDIHIAPAPRPPLNIDPAARLRAALAHIARYSGAERVVITGDLTHAGDVASYEILRGILAETALPVHLMVGNHDRRDNFQAVFPDAPRDAGGFVQHFLDVGPDRLIFLDTLNGPPYSYPFSHTGHLCEARLAWLDAALDTGKRSVLFLHHPPFNTGFAAMDAIRLHRSEPLFEIIARHGNVAHMVMGHVHRVIHGSYRGLPFTTFKSLVGQMPMLFDLMDFHMESAEAPGYGLIDLGTEGITVHVEDFGQADLEAIALAAQKASSQP